MNKILGVLLVLVMMVQLPLMAQQQLPIVVKSQDMATDMATMPFKIAILQQVNNVLNAERNQSQERLNLLERFSAQQAIGSEANLQFGNFSPATKIDAQIMAEAMKLYMNDNQREALTQSSPAHQQQVLNALWKMCYRTQGELNALKQRSETLTRSIVGAGKWEAFQAWVPGDLQAQEVERLAQKELLRKRAEQKRQAAEERRREAQAIAQARKAEKQRLREERRKAARERAEAYAYFNALNNRRYSAYGYRYYRYGYPVLYYPRSHYGYGYKKKVTSGTYQGYPYTVYRVKGHGTGYRHYYNHKTNTGFHIYGGSVGVKISY